VSRREGCKDSTRNKHGGNFAVSDEEKRVKVNAGVTGIGGESVRSAI